MCPRSMDVDDMVGMSALDIGLRVHASPGLYRLILTQLIPLSLRPAPYSALTRKQLKSLKG